MKIQCNVAAILCLFYTYALGQTAPNMISYQGRVTDQLGRAMASGVYSIIIRIWDDPTSNDFNNHVVWAKKQSVTVQSNGVFSTLLGSPGSSDVFPAMVNDLRFAFSSPNRFLGLTIVSVNGAIVSQPSEILPRQQVLGSPFAFRADFAETVADASITTSKIAIGAVGSAQLAAGVIGFTPRSIQVFTSNGTWTKPPGVSNVYVKVIGAGGRGGSAGDSQGHGGGGGGGYSEGVVAVTGDVPVVIGATNSFGTILATAGGDASGFGGGLGGVGLGGSINLPGGAGQSVVKLVNGAGGMGGASAFGAGGAGGGFDYNTLYPARNGAKFGGGGGGATNLGSGGSGDPGAVIVYY